MQNLNNIPNKGTFNEIAKKVNQNFALIQDAIENVDAYDCGYYSHADELRNAHPSPIKGQHALVGDNMEIYRCEADGLWTATGTYDQRTSRVVYEPDIQMDAAPVENSPRPVTSGGVFSHTKQVVERGIRSVIQKTDEFPMKGSPKLVTSDGIFRFAQQEVARQVESLTPIHIEGDVTNAADEEDLTSEEVNGGAVLRRKNKVYAPLAFSGKGRKYLRKNLSRIGSQHTNLLTQAMVSDANTIYEIQYDYDLDGATLTIPEGCTLHFDGGSIYNGTVVWNDTLLTGDVIMADIAVAGGRLRNNEVYVDWFGTDGTGSVDDSYPILAAIASLKKDGGTLIFGENKTYLHGDGIEDAETGTGMNYVNVVYKTVDGVDFYSPDFGAIKNYNEAHKTSIVASPATLGRDIRLMFERFSSLTIDGRGANIVSNPENGITSHNGILCIVGCNDVTVRNLTVDGNKEARFEKLGVRYGDYNSGRGHLDWHNVMVRYSKRVTFEGVNNLNSCHNGFDIKQCYVYKDDNGASDTGFDIRFSYQQSPSGLPAGKIRVADEPVEDVSVINCHVSACWKNGIGMNNGRGLRVEGGEFVNCGTGTAFSPKASIDLEREGDNSIVGVNISRVSFRQDLDVQTEVMGELYVVSGTKSVSVNECVFENCGLSISSQGAVMTTGISVRGCSFKNSAVIVGGYLSEVSSCVMEYSGDFYQYNGQLVVRREYSPIYTYENVNFHDNKVRWSPELDEYPNHFVLKGYIQNNEFMGLCGGNSTVSPVKNYIIDLGAKVVNGNKFTTLMFEYVYDKIGATSSASWKWVSPGNVKYISIFSTHIQTGAKSKTSYMWVDRDVEVVESETYIYTVTDVLVPKASNPYIICRKSTIASSSNDFEGSVSLTSGFFTPDSGGDFQSRSKMLITRSILLGRTENFVTVPIPYSPSKLSLKVAILNEKYGSEDAATKYIYSDYTERKTRGYYTDGEVNTNLSIKQVGNISALVFDFSSVTFNGSRWVWISVEIDYCLYNPKPWTGVIVSDVLPDGAANAWPRLRKSGTWAQRATGSALTNYYPVGATYYCTDRSMYLYFNGTTWVDGEGRTAALNKGNTAQRPTASLTATDSGFQYFDTTLGKPIYWTGTAWVDATGTAV